MFQEEKGWDRCALGGWSAKSLSLRTGCALSGCSHSLKSSLCSPSPFLFIYFHKWFSINGASPVSKTNWCWALCQLHCWKYPQACLGLELGRLMDSLSVLTFIPVSSCPWDAQCLCTPTKQSHKYLHTQGFSRRLLHLAALPQPCLCYPLCSMGASWGRTEIQDLVTVWSLGVFAVQRKVTL